MNGVNSQQYYKLNLAINNVNKNIIDKITANDAKLLLEILKNDNFKKNVNKSNNLEWLENNYLNKNFSSILQTDKIDNLVLLLKKYIITE